MNAPQVGGASRSALGDIQMAAKGGIFLILILIIVFPHIIPESASAFLITPIGQAGALVVILLLAILIGFDAAIFGALAFLLAWSYHSVPKAPVAVPTMVPQTGEQAPEEGFTNYTRPLVFLQSPSAKVVPNQHKWFVEKVLKEEPYIIEDDVVRTSPVQDNSERSQNRSTVSR